MFSSTKRIEVDRIKYSVCISLIHIQIIIQSQNLTLKLDAEPYYIQL